MFNSKSQYNTPLKAISVCLIYALILSNICWADSTSISSPKFSLARYTAMRDPNVNAAMKAKMLRESGRLRIALPGTLYADLLERNNAQAFRPQTDLYVVLPAIADSDEALADVTAFFDTHNKDKRFYRVASDKLPPAADCKKEESAQIEVRDQCPPYVNSLKEAYEILERTRYVDDVEKVFEPERALHVKNRDNDGFHHQPIYRGMHRRLEIRRALQGKPVRSIKLWQPTYWSNHVRIALMHTMPLFFRDLRSSWIGVLLEISPDVARKYGLNTRLFDTSTWKRIPMHQISRAWLTQTDTIDLPDPFALNEAVRRGKVVQVLLPGMTSLFSAVRPSPKGPIGDSGGYVNTLVDEAERALAQGDYETALAKAEEALGWFDRLAELRAESDDRGLIQFYENLARKDPKPSSESVFSDKERKRAEEISDAARAALSQTTDNDAGHASPAEELGPESVAFPEPLWTGSNDPTSRAGAESSAVWALSSPDGFRKAFGGVRPIHDPNCHEAIKRAFEEHVTKGAKILELGVGLGYVTRHIPTEYLDGWTGLDINRAFLNETARPIAPNGKKMPVVQADVNQLPFEDNSFDVVIDSAVLDTVDNLRGCLDEVRRVLRPGGVFIQFLDLLPGHESYGDNRAIYYQKLVDEMNRSGLVWTDLIRVEAVTDSIKGNNPADPVIFIAIKEGTKKTTGAQMVENDASHDSGDRTLPVSIDSVRQAFSVVDDIIDGKAIIDGKKEKCMLKAPVSRLDSTCQKIIDLSPSKLRLCVPVDVLMNSSDIIKAFREGLGDQVRGTIPLELVVTGVTEDNMYIVDGLGRREIKEALNLPENLTVSPITEDDIQERSQRIGVDGTRPQIRAEIVKQLSLEVNPLSQGEYMAIATDAVSKSDAKAVEEDLKPVLEDNISIRVLIEPKPDESTFSLARILRHWLKSLQHGKKSSIGIILPKMISPKEMIERLDNAIRNAWRVLAAA